MCVQPIRSNRNRASRSLRWRAFHSAQIGLLVLTLGACLVQAKPSAPALIGPVAVADGEPLRIVRRDSLMSGSKGVVLLSEDIVSTSADAFVAISLSGGSLIGIGPSTEVYFLQNAELTTVRVLKGWVKADVKSGLIRLEGTRLAIQARKAVVLLHAAERSDEIFDEQGSALLLLRNDAAVREDRETAENQFFVREERFDVSVQPRPSDDFVKAMPIPFRDPLPGQVLLPQPVSSRLLHPVAYSDIEAWLSSPRDWRAGFTRRFRARLKDPGFFAAMDAHLTLFPEWRDILHPPPPPTSTPGRADTSDQDSQPGHEPR
jgi:hypothetical protein